jgi:hypothetical protein
VLLFPWAGEGVPRRVPEEATSLDFVTLALPSPMTEPEFSIDLPPDPSTLRIEFEGEIWYWRGPSPYRFITVPDEACVGLRAIAADVTYGWGMIPVRVRIRDTTFETSLFPKDGRYVVPIKDVVRKAEGIVEGDVVAVELAIRS